MTNTELLRRITSSECRSHARFSAAGEAVRFGPIVALQPAATPGPLDRGWLDNAPALEAQHLLMFENWCARFGLPATLQLLSHQAPNALPLLQKRGYTLEYVLHVYTHDLQNLPTLGSAVQVEQETDAEYWAALSARGFGEGSEEIMRRVASAAGTKLFVAKLEGQEVASGAVALEDGVAALHGTSTLPEERGKGAQTALLAHRLHYAKEAGADLATVFVTPGSGSERNAERAGFRLVGARLTFRR